MAEKKPEQRNKRPRFGRKGSTDPNVDPEERLRELSEELFNLRFQFATRQLTNTSRIREVRRDIARVKTMQRQRELEAANATSNATAKKGAA